VKSSIIFAWLAELGLITWRDFKTQRTVLGIPPPSDYAATFVVYGGLLAVGSVQGGETFAALAAWSLVLASALNLVNPTFVTPAGPQKTTTSSAPLAATPIISTTPTTARSS
jgi:hypothetical protein